MIYYQTLKFAREHDEIDICRKSREEDLRCRNTIEKLVDENYYNNRFDSAKVVKEAVIEFGLERVKFILANTVQQKDWDGRISETNKRWAKSVPVSLEEEYQLKILLGKTHPVLLNTLIDEIRENYRTKYSVTTKEALRRACIDNNWFTAGTNEQYEKLFYANENGCPLEEIATIIWLCSDDERCCRRDIKTTLEKIRDEFQQSLIN
jgi:hypothetical protein